MLTRGRHANHLYLQVVGDGDPHTLIRPDTISPRTPTETLQQILARDEAPISASTVLRRAQRPSGPALPGGAALHRQPPRRRRTTCRTTNPRRARPRRHSTCPDSPPNPPGRPSGPTCSTSPPKLASIHSATYMKPPAVATSQPQETWPPSSTGASQQLTHTRSQVRCPGSHASHTRFRTIPSGVTYLAKRSQLRRRPRRPDPRPSQLRADGQPVWAATGKPPEHRTHRRNRSMAGRQRHQSPRPTTNRRNPTRNAPRPLETTPRPGYRACHQPASRCEGRRATGSTHRT